MFLAFKARDSSDQFAQENYLGVNVTPSRFYHKVELKLNKLLLLLKSNV